MATRLGQMGAVMEALNGRPVAQQNVNVTTTSGRQSTAYTGGHTVMIINDGSNKMYFKVGDSSVVASATDGIPLAADEKFVCILKSTDTHIAFITTSSTTTARIYTLE